jgi:threonine dehydrogenase-like Zn-dependent dehydrogenase
MRAVAVIPRSAQGARLDEVPDPEPDDGQILVKVHEVGVDGTDAEIVAGDYGEAPPGKGHLIIGHESLGRVEDVGGEAGPGFTPGDWVVAMVRRPDPVACENCARGEPDLCLNGQYTERGIKGAHGFLAERYAEEPQFLISVPDEQKHVAVLLEPLSVVVKAVEHMERIQARMFWNPQRALVLGAGSIGLLAAMLLRLHGLDVWVYDRAARGVKRDLAEAMGAHFISAEERPLGHELATETGPLDIIVEATGFSPLAFDAIDLAGPNGIVCLAGVSSGSRKLRISVDHLNLEMVLMNKVVFGTVSSNRRHFEAGVTYLAEIESRWPGVLPGLITRRVSFTDFAAAFERSDADIKAVIDIASP